MKNINYQSQLYEILGIRPIAYNVAFVKITGSVNSALFLSQLLYWFGKGKWDNWVYKTIKECEKETGLSRKQQEKAVDKLVEKNIVQLKLKGIPRRRFFLINLPILYSLLGIKDPVHNVPNGLTITETTSETTSETTPVKNVDPLKDDPFVEKISRWAYERASTPPSCSKEAFKRSVLVAIQRVGAERVRKSFEKEDNSIRFLTTIKNL